MQNELTIIDAVEKLKTSIFALDPEAEGIREGLLSPGHNLDFPDLIREAYLAAYLNIGLDTSERRRSIHGLLSNIRENKQYPDLQIGGEMISDNKIEYLRQGLHRLDDLIGNDVIKREMKSGIQKALIKLDLRDGLGLKGVKIYRFLSVLGFPVAVGSSSKHRFLERLGWMKEKGGSVKALQEYHSLCENTARLAGESIQSLDFIFSRFSVQGQRQHPILPICGSSPKCASCVLTPYCFYYRHFVKGKTPDETKLSMPYMPRDDRPREQLEHLGSVQITDSNLLAIILRTGMKKRTAVNLAEDLLRRFGSLRNLAEVSLTELCRVKGIGKVKAIEIKAALEMGKRALDNSRKDKTIILESLDVFRFYRSETRDLKQESFFLLILNSRNQVTKKVEISRGTLDASMVHPREVFREAIRESASSVIFYHNHPSGDPNPSRADILITERLKKSAEVLGIKVLDHIIMGEDGFYSFADQGLL